MGVAAHVPLESRDKRETSVSCFTPLSHSDSQSPHVPTGTLLPDSRVFRKQQLNVDCACGHHPVCSKAWEMRSKQVWGRRLTPRHKWTLIRRVHAPRPLAHLTSSAPCFTTRPNFLAACLGRPLCNERRCPLDVPELPMSPSWRSVCRPLQSGPPSAMPVYPWVCFDVKQMKFQIKRSLSFLPTTIRVPTDARTGSHVHGRWRICPQWESALWWHCLSVFTSSVIGSSSQKRASSPRQPEWLLLRGDSRATLLDLLIFIFPQNTPPKPEGRAAVLLPGPVTTVNVGGFVGDVLQQYCACPLLCPKGRATIGNPWKERNETHTQEKLHPHCSVEQAGLPGCSQGALGNGLPHPGPASDETAPQAGSAPCFGLGSGQVLFFLSHSEDKFLPCHWVTKQSQIRNLPPSPSHLNQTSALTCLVGNYDSLLATGLLMMCVPPPSSTEELGGWQDSLPTGGCPLTHGPNL